MGYQGRFQEENQPKQKKKFGKFLLIPVLVLFLLVGAVAVWGIRYYNGMFDKMTVVTVDKNLYDDYREENGETAEPDNGPNLVDIIKQPFVKKDIYNILVVGQASREGESYHMADSAILVTVNTYDGTVRLSSVQRDTLVSLPAYKSHTEGRSKFNIAYHLGHTWEGIEGAMAYTNLTMYRNFGVEVDHNVEVDFESFTKLIDYMGGVEIELTEAEAKYLNNDDLYVLYDVKPGLQYLDGMAALSYARMRKAEGDGESDIVRTARQRKLISVMFDKIRGMTLKELQGVADTLLPLVTTTLTPGDVADILVGMVPHLKNLEIQQGTIPVESTYWGDMVDIYGDGVLHSVLKFDAEQNKKLIREFTEKN